MEQIQSANGLATWNVLSNELRIEPSGRRSNIFKVACSICGYEKQGRKFDIQKIPTCRGCTRISKNLPTEKPNAVKLDNTGACISICEIGTVEFIRDYQEKHKVSEREAVNAFIESAKANIPIDDPFQDTLTPESIRAKVRRATGKKDHTKSLGDSPQVNRTYKVQATFESATAFIEKYLPDYTLVKVNKKPDNKHSSRQ